MSGFSRSHFSFFRVAGVSVSSLTPVEAMEEAVPVDAVQRALSRALIAWALQKALGHRQRAGALS